MELGLATQESLGGLTTTADGTLLEEPKRAKKKKRQLGEDGVPERRGPTCMDAKSVLNQYLQKHFDRPVNKGEILYSTSQLPGGGGYQSSLVITGLGDTPMSGDTKANAKDAEHAAAWMGLQTFREVLSVPEEVIEAVQKELDERAVGGHKKPRPMPAPTAGAESQGSWAPPAFGGGKGKGGKFMPPWMNQQMMDFAQMMMGWKGKGCCKGAGFAGKGKAGRGAGRTGGSGHEWEDAKCRLNTWLQLQLKRPLGKDETRYQMQQLAGGYQATLTLVCMEMQEFAGEVMPTQKEAEKSAAAQALKHFGVEVASPAAQKRPGDGLNAAGTAGAAVAGGDARSTVVSFLQTQLNRPVAPSEIDLQTAQYSEGFQTTVTFKFNGEQVVGEVGPTLKEAERLAAAMVLQVYGGQGKGR